MNPTAIKVACSNCNLRELCLPVGLSTPDLERLDGLVAQRRHIPRGEDLFRTGERFAQVYAVRSGFFKTGLMLEDGREQVTGFQMTGELLGLDGISTDAHTVTATALEDSQVCVIPFDQLEELGAGAVGPQDDLELAGVFLGDIVEDGGDHLAGAAPFGPVVHQNRLRRLQHFGFEGVIGDVMDVLAHVMPRGMGQCPE